VAEEDQKAEENPKGEGKSKKKLIIIIALVAVLAIGLSVGATIYLLGGSEPEVIAEDVIAEPTKEPAIYLSINPPFLVTFNVDGRQRYMQISVSVSSRDGGALDTLEYHMPLILSKLRSMYGAQVFDEIKTDSGKLALQSKTVDVINEILAAEGASQIENVYFTNFVLQ